MVLGLCRVLLRDTVEAEDAAQQTFVDAHQALLGGAVVRDDPAWLAAIARNECRARIVARMREPLALSYGDLIEAAGSSEPEEHEVLSDDVRCALAELPEQQREAVVLRDVYGLRYREVGVVLGLSRPAVESVLFRARRHLRKRLRPASGSLVIPLALRDSLAQTLPGFAGGEGGAAAVGAAGATGLLVKLSSGPIAAKLAAGAVAIGAGGGSLSVALDRDGPRPPDRTPILVTGRSAANDGQSQHTVASTEVAMTIHRHRGRRADKVDDQPRSGGRAVGNSRDGDSSRQGGRGQEAIRDDSGGSSGPGPSGTESGASRSGPDSDSHEGGSRDADPMPSDGGPSEQTSDSSHSGPGSGSGGPSPARSGSGGRDGRTEVALPSSGFDGSTGSGEGSGTSPQQPSSSGPDSVADAAAVEDSSGSGSGSGTDPGSGSGTDPDSGSGSGSGTDPGSGSGSGTDPGSGFGSGTDD